MSQIHSCTLFNFMFFMLKISILCFLKWFLDKNILYHYFYWLKKYWFDHSIFFISGKLNFWFLVYSSSIVPTLWQCWKLHNFSTLVVQCWVNIGTLVNPQHSYNVQVPSSECFGNIEKYIIFQHYHNIVTTFPKCCSLVGFQRWTPTFMQQCLNIVWMLWLIVIFNIVSIMWQRCRIMLWQHCHNVMI